VGVPTYLYSPVLASVPSILNPPLAGSSTGPCHVVPDGGPQSLWEPFVIPLSSLGSSSFHPETTTGWLLHWALPWGP